MEGMGLEPDRRWTHFVRRGEPQPPPTITAGRRNFPEALDALIRMGKQGYHDMNMGQMELMARHLVAKTKPSEAEIQDYGLSPEQADLFTDHSRLAELSQGIVSSPDPIHQKAREVEGYSGPSRNTAEKAGEMVDDGQGGFTPAPAADPRADSYGYGYMSEANRQTQDLLRIRNLINSLGQGNLDAGAKYNDGVGPDGKPKAYMFDHLFDFTTNYGSDQDWETFLAASAVPDTALGTVTRFSTGNTLDPLKKLNQEGMVIEDRYPANNAFSREQMLDITSVVPPTLANAGSVISSIGVGAVHGDKPLGDAWDWSGKRSAVQENAYGYNPYNTGTDFQQRQERQQEARDIHNQANVLDARNTAKINTGRELSWGGNFVSELAPEVLGDAFTWASGGISGALTGARAATKTPKVALQVAGQAAKSQAGRELAEEGLTGGLLTAGLQMVAPARKSDEEASRQWLRSAPQRQQNLNDYVKRNRPEY